MEDFEIVLDVNMINGGGYNITLSQLQEEVDLLISVGRGDADTYSTETIQALIDYIRRTSNYQ